MILPSIARNLTLGLTVVAAASCVPRQNDAAVGDMDGDGVPDAFDSCMADAEDMDGFEDEDGCPEKGSPETAKASGLVTEKVEDVAAKTETVKKEKALELKVSKATAKASLFRKSAGEATFDEGERNAVVFGFGKAWLYTGGKLKHTIRQYVFKADFSPEGDKVALVGATHFIVADTKTGKLLRKFKYAKGTQDSPETKAILFDGNDAVTFFDGCQLHKAAATGRSKTTTIGDRKCGRPLHSADGTQWFIWQQEEEAVQVHKIDLGSGDTTLALGGEGDAPGLSMLIASPNGKQLCYSRHRDGSELSCRDVAAKTDLMVWKGPSDKRAVFTEAGTLAFGGGALRTDRPLIVAKVESKDIYRVGELAAKDEWLSPAGTDGVVASGGQRLVHLDFEAKTRREVQLDKGEWEGLSVIPGKTDEFVIGKERKGSRDLFRVTVQ